MFDNIGGKIKNFAKVLTFISLILSSISIIYGFDRLYADDSSLFLVYVFIIPITSYISFMALYALGEIVELLTVILMKLNNIENK